jgi:cytochrome c oxidase subunit 4
MERAPALIRVKYRLYVLVWGSLCALTAATVFAAAAKLPGWGILIAVAIAGVKSYLVVSYFMHLRHDRGLRLIKYVFALVLVLLVVFIGLTFVDEVFR